MDLASVTESDDEGLARAPEREPGAASAAVANTGAIIIVVAVDVASVARLGWQIAVTDDDGLNVPDVLRRTICCRKSATTWDGWE